MAEALAKKPDPAHQVFNWIVAGQSEHEILEGITHHFPGEDPKPLIVAAFAQITAAGKIEADTLRGWCVAATQNVYQKALEAGDFSTALRAIKQLQCIPD